MGEDNTGTLAVTGNEAVAEAMRQINPDVVCAYPITPQTEVVQLYAQMVADGKVTSEFVTVESEHSAMSAVIGSAAGGARTMTATSSQGFALMWELLFVASSYRLPIVMTTVNRALSGPSTSTATTATPWAAATPAGSSSTARTTSRPTTTASRPSASPSTWTCARRPCTCTTATSSAAPSAPW